MMMFGSYVQEDTWSSVPHVIKYTFGRENEIKYLII